ncbi:MAG: tRNA lysidine(34) synthetase TilS, partial [Muribaculaceae bacterium]|nr:tRNA lysidine(34) synthetase TilS [Muribaculaceae bacterium]
MTLTETVSAGYAACGVSAGSRIGIALSGGADSVALLAASVRLGFEVVPLHCNFHLRGAESDRDERFVRSLCARLGLADWLHLTDFDVYAQMCATGESVEMACRTLRYRWFEELAGALGLTAVAVGHHADDDAETFVLNLMRGTGLRGLAGMPRSRDLFVRPMIGCTRAEVLDFLSTEGLDYVTDSTNLADEYMRNRVRHAV